MVDHPKPININERIGAVAYPDGSVGLFWDRPPISQEGAAALVARINAYNDGTANDGLAALEEDIRTIVKAYPGSLLRGGNYSEH